MGLQLNISTQIDGFLTATSGTGESVEDTIDVSAVQSLVTGSGANQADAYYSQNINIAASGSETLDLATLTDPLGAALNFTRVKAIYVQADAANANSIVIGGAGVTPFVGPFNAGTDTISVAPGGVALLTNPSAAAWVVGTGINLELANSSSGTAVTGKLVIIGARE